MFIVIFLESSKNWWRRQFYYFSTCFYYEKWDNFILFCRVLSYLQSRRTHICFQNSRKQQESFGIRDSTLFYGKIMFFLMFFLYFEIISNFGEPSPVFVFLKDRRRFSEIRDFKRLVKFFWSFLFFSKLSRILEDPRLSSQTTKTSSDPPKSEIPRVFLCFGSRNCRFFDFRNYLESRRILGCLCCFGRQARILRDSRMRAFFKGIVNKIVDFL